MRKQREHAKKMTKVCSRRNKDFEKQKKRQPIEITGIRKEMNNKIWRANYEAKEELERVNRMKNGDCDERELRI
jgi:hypothetical protein